jgi:hypothetical protein
MNNGLGSGLLEIAMALIGVALLALLVGNASKTNSIISQAGETCKTAWAISAVARSTNKKGA